ncbi:MAG TPA: DHA2 family efflux MFS transporter permease subunit [Pseudonocardia sp.]|jgi:EmrB/QacA subfamily drug resistance transporter
MSAAPTSVAGASAAPPAGRGWALPLAVLVVGMFMSVLDISIVNVAVPAIQKDFGTTTDDIQWITTAYSLALGVVVPVSGWLGDRIGLTRTYSLSLLGFAACSALCGIAWDLNSMIAFRILQAVPGGILPVVTLAMLYRIVPREKIGTAMGVYGLGIVFAPAIGPTLGGYLVQYVDWRLIFFINVPIGLLGVALAMVVLPAFPTVRAGRFDVFGFVTVAAGLFALLLALSEGQDWGWTSYPVLMLIVGGLLCLALFVVIELEVDEPLIDVRVFALWPFTNSLVLVTLLSVGLFGVLFYVPLFLQEGQGVEPLRTGLILLPEALVMGLIMPVAGVLYDRIGPRWPAVVGLTVAAYGTYLLCGITADVPQSDIVLWTCVRAAGNGLAMMSVMTAGLSVVPTEKVNQAGAVNNVVQRVASALGLAVLTSLITTQQAQLMADRSGLVRAADPTSPEPLRLMGEQGVAGLYPVARRLNLEVLASTYADAFVVTALVTAVGAGLALLLKLPPGGQGPVMHAEGGSSVPPEEQADRPAPVPPAEPVPAGAVPVLPTAAPTPERRLAPLGPEG